MVDAPAPDDAALDHRRGPRRRGDRLFSAVFDAVLAELAEHGYGGLTVDGVAGRARVSKASLYRRWPGKKDLVLAAVLTTLPDPDDLVDTGSLRGDLLAWFHELAAQLQGPAGSALRGILGGVLGDPDSATELYASRHRGRSAEQLRALLHRAVDRGELTEQQVVRVTARQLEAGPATLRHQYLWQAELGDGLCREIVDEVVLPLLAPATGGVRAQA